MKEHDLILNEQENNQPIETVPATAVSSDREPTAAPRGISRFGRHWVTIALILILMLGAVFRLTGVDWDEGQHLHPDERFLTMVLTAIRLPDSIGDYFDTDKSPLNPYNNNFGSFVYGTAPLFIVRIAGELLKQTDYGDIHLLGRELSALFDLLTCLMVFFIARRMFNERVGLLAAFFYTCAVLAIQQSHFFTVDSFGNVPIVLTFWFALDIAEGKRGWFAYALAGAFLGLAIASRINFLMFAAILAMAGLLRLVTLFGELRRASVSVPALNLARTYQFDAGVVAEGAEAVSPHLEDGQVRTINIGPFVIEVETRRRPPVAHSPEQAETIALTTPSFWNSIFYVGTGLAIATLATILVFRLAQPYAFKGLIGFNPKFLDDMKFISQLISGEIDYPPSHQWTDRAPYLFPLYNIFNYGLGIPLALAAWAGFLVSLYEIIRHRKWNHLLMTLWVGGFFLYQGQQFVKVVRYFLPLYPFLVIYAAFFLFWLWQRAQSLIFNSRSSEQRLRIKDYVPAAVVGILALITVGYTLFWAAAFTTIYTRPVTRVEASHWIVHNIPEGSVIANEHWDDPLPMRVEGLDPLGGMFKSLSSSSDGLIQMYWEDSEEKRPKVIEWLDEADYIVLSSNRLYQSIPRLPERYPLATKYYEWLFNGQLGFELYKTFTSYPQLFGIVINDDSSDEAFTVYDHPKVLLFKKTAAYSHDNTAKLINSVDLSEVIRLKPIDATASRGGYRLPPNLLSADYQGGTWSEIFDPNDLANRVPVVAWVVVIWLLGIVAFPYAFLAFRRFADRGYSFAKALGILGVAWLSWTMASYEVMPFTRTTILLMSGVFVVGALLIAWRQRADLFAFVRHHILLIGIIELVYLAFFAIDLLIRYGNPDLWHPNFGGEKPMDFTYLNAIIKTTFFPAYNPWFQGGFINYYYFGQLISATLVKLTGIVPEVSYNLLLPMFFGLTASAAFGVTFNLLKSPISSLESRDQRLETRDYLRPILAGLAAACLVLIIGNLGEIGVFADGVMRLGEQSADGARGVYAFVVGIAAWVFGGKEIPVSTGNWYWTATRVIPDTINEFPFFTFVYADLHAHLMSLPFGLVALGLAAHSFVNRARLAWYDLGIIALVLGALRAINTWDYPTYLAIIGAAMVVGYFIEQRAVPEGEFDWGEWLQRYLIFIVIGFIQVAALVVPTNAAGTRVTFDVAIYVLVLAFAVILGWVMVGARLDPRRIINELGWKMIALIALGVALYWPYIINYGTAYTSVELWKDNRTELQSYLIVHGIFLFIITTYLAIIGFNRHWRTMRSADSKNETGAARGDGMGIYLLPALAILEVGMLFLGLTVFALVVPLVVLCAWIILQRDTAPLHRFNTLLIAVALLLTLMVEVITLKGDIGRMNTVFKFYLQAWVLFSVSGAVGLATVFNVLRFRTREQLVAPAASPEATDLAPVTVKDHGFGSALLTLKAMWWGLLALLLLVGFMYPILATWAKVNDRMVGGSPPGLNGLDYMRTATYNEDNHILNLNEDYEAIQWLRQNIKGSPVIVEANTGLYRWGNRVTINTGLPTIIGWDWHTKQQYSLLPGDIVDQRIRDVKTIYESPDPNDALQLMRHYGATLLYVGPLEKAVYAAEGLSKFTAMAETGALTKLYDANGVQIYQLVDRPSALLR